MGSGTWRDSRRSYGSEESDNGARLRWIWLGGGHGFPVAVLAWKKMAERKWQDEEQLSKALAFIRSTDARRGDANRACTPHGGQPLYRSATANTEGFCETSIQCSMVTTDSATLAIYIFQTVVIWFMV